MISGKNFIGYTSSAEGLVKFRTFNPMTNASNPWVMTEATTDEIFRATSLAWSAFREYRQTSPEKRAGFLESVANEIEELGEMLIETYCAESGLPAGRAQGELTRTLFQLRSFAALLRGEHWVETSVDHAEPERTPVPKPDLRKTYIPLGPVAVFGSSNFPLAYSTAGGDTASALAAGCPVIVKSHPMHAGTGELVASAVLRAAKENGMPDGVFSNLNSKGIEVGVQLVKNPNIKAVGFTGSIRGGRALFDLAAQREEPIPVFAEMGSINPVVITQEALKQRGAHWAAAYADSITLGTGQFCTNPGLILAVESPELMAFSVELADQLSDKPSTCMLHPDIHAAYDRLRGEVSTQSGVNVLSRPVEAAPNFAEQTVAMVKGSEFLANPKLHQEVFGPFSVIVECADMDQLLLIIERLEGQLTGTLIAEENELENLGPLVDAMQYRVGRLIFNGVPTGVEVCPSMQHGGPYPASTDARFTAVGVHSIRRWIRPVAFQNFPKTLLPDELKE